MRAPRLRHPRLFALTPESPPCPLRPRYVRELFRLARLGKAAELRAILEKLGRGNPLLQTRDYSGRSLVLTAAREGSVAVVRALLTLTLTLTPTPILTPTLSPTPTLTLTLTLTLTRLSPSRRHASSENGSAAYATRSWSSPLHT